MDRLLINISTLYRGLNKYLDRVLKPYGFGSGQFLFIIMINEQEGISMNEIIMNSSFDKGTVSKTMQKLEEEDYIYYKVDQKDKRIKRIYTTKKTGLIMNELYQIRKDLYEHLSKDVDNDILINIINSVANNSMEFLEEKDHQIKIGGLQKLSLVDYPNNVASTIFTSGCNFKCPYCHNKDLVFVPSNTNYYEVDEIMNHLIKRKNILSGVVISGGEPLLHNGLIELIYQIKELGFKIKLDTNGYYPDQLLKILNTGQIDYVAMDIKNSKSKYAETAGVNQEAFNINMICDSIDIIMNSNVDYEFRTTITNELHSIEDIKEIAQWIKGANSFYLQAYVSSKNVINPMFTSPTIEFLNELREVSLPYIENTKIRGGI